MPDEQTANPAATGTPPTEAAPAAAGQTETATPTPSAPDPAALQAKLAALEQKYQQDVGVVSAKTDANNRAIVQLIQALSQPQPDKATQDEREEQLRTALEQNPSKALDQAFHDRVAPLMQSRDAIIAQQERRLAEDRIKSNGDGELYDKYKSQVEAFMQEVKSATRALPGAWEDAFDLIIAKNRRDVFDYMTNRKVESEKQSALESSSPARGSRSGPTPPTEQQKKMAEAFGMKLEDYMKHAAELAREEA